MNQKVGNNILSPDQALLPRIDPLMNEAGTQPDPLAHALVEDYLDRVCRPLIETHSYAVRSDLRQELSQHIRSLIYAYEEMGDMPVIAAENALAKFGDADRVARQWKLPPATKRRKPMRRWFRQQWQGIAATLAASSFAIAVCGGVSFRYLEVRPPVARQQPQPSRTQPFALAANIGAHSHWTSQHQCIECHRGNFIRNGVLEPGFANEYLRLP